MEAISTATSLPRMPRLLAWDLALLVGSGCARYWVPVAYEQDLGDFAKKIRILGENLVIYRDKQGTIGPAGVAMQPSRAHLWSSGSSASGASSAATTAGATITDGTILETPGEPEDSTLKDRLCHGAYPTQVHLGIVFAYMGPPELMPPLPVYDTFRLPDVRY